ncbi:S9 family peptidase [Candidatus Poribacteria bacterium]|nr:S9 family peptidase [Candidatus Poribacteria bacterium]
MKFLSQYLFTIEDAISWREFMPQMPIALSPNGEWLAYSVKSQIEMGWGAGEFLPNGTPAMATGGEVWVTNLQTQEHHHLIPGSTSWGPSWSPDGRRLAFYSDKNGAPQLWLWEPLTDQLRQLSDATVRPFYNFQVPKWTPDGTRVVCKFKTMPTEFEPSLKVTDQKVTETDGVTAQVWTIKPKMEDKKGELPWAVRELGDIGIVTVATGELQYLARRMYPVGMQVSPDGHHVAVTCKTADGYDLYLIPLRREPIRRLVEGIKLGAYPIVFSWSPDGRHIAYINEKDVFVIGVEGGVERNLTVALNLNFQRALEQPLWSQDGQSIFCVGGHELFQLSIEGRPARHLTKDLPREILGAVHSCDDNTIWSPNEGQSIYVHTLDPDTKQEGIYRIDLASGNLSMLVEENRYYGLPLSGRASRLHLYGSTDGKFIVYIAEDTSHPQGVWLADTKTFQNRRRITAINPHVESASFGERRTISWQTPEGKTLQGILLLPVGYEEGKRYPLITWIYGGAFFSRDMNKFNLYQTAEDPQFLANHGYAVLLPDVPLETGDPLKQLPKVVLPAIEHVIELGVADSNRLGLYGQSYGGYCVNALITQTTRFRAAVSISGMSNLSSLYGTVNEDSASSWTYWAEKGQGRIGGPPWEFPERYVENSPIFHLNKVETPLLLIHGTADDFYSQSKEMFSGLRRLEKEVVFVRYVGETHAFGSYRRANIIDAWHRILEWFEAHLKSG